MKKIALAVAALLISVSAMAGNNYKLPFGIVRYQSRLHDQPAENRLQGTAQRRSRNDKEKCERFQRRHRGPRGLSPAAHLRSGRTALRLGKIQGRIADRPQPDERHDQQLQRTGTCRRRHRLFQFRQGTRQCRPGLQPRLHGQVLECGKRGRPRKHVPKTDRNLDRRHGVDCSTSWWIIRYNGVFSKKDIANIGDLASINTRPTSWTFTIGYLF